MCVCVVSNFSYPSPRHPSINDHGSAGRFGRAVSLVTQFDVGLVHGIEALTGSKMEACPDVKEEDVVMLLNPVAKATRTARMRLMELGFDEQVAEHARRKKKDKKERRQKQGKEGRATQRAKP